jgi:DNA-directed RNA polymerase omega subunit
MFKVSEAIGSKYRFVTLCAQRAKQLLEGADPRVESTLTKPAAIATQELLSDKITWSRVETEAPQIPDTTQTIEVEVGA